MLEEELILKIYIKLSSLLTFSDFGRNITSPEKKFFINSILNHIEFHKNKLIDLLYKCYLNKTLSDDFAFDTMAAHRKFYGRGGMDELNKLIFSKEFEYNESFFNKMINLIDQF